MINIEMYVIDSNVRKSIAESDSTKSPLCVVLLPPSTSEWNVSRK